jgi:hypothetical protein
MSSDQLHLSSLPKFLVSKKKIWVPEVWLWDVSAASQGAHLKMHEILKSQFFSRPGMCPKIWGLLACGWAVFRTQKNGHQ